MGAAGAGMSHALVMGQRCVSHGLGCMSHQSLQFKNSAGKSYLGFCCAPHSALQKALLGRGTGVLCTGFWESKPRHGTYTGFAAPGLGAGL